MRRARWRGRAPARQRRGTRAGWLRVRRARRRGTRADWMSEGARPPRWCDAGETGVANGAYLLIRGRGRKVPRASGGKCAHAACVLAMDQVLGLASRRKWRLCARRRDVDRAVSVSDATMAPVPSGGSPRAPTIHRCRASYAKIEQRLDACLQRAPVGLATVHVVVDDRRQYVEPLSLGWRRWRSDSWRRALLDGFGDLGLEDDLRRIRNAADEVRLIPGRSGEYGEDHLLE
jgi:hypothetical protein